MGVMAGEEETFLMWIDRERSKIYKFKTIIDNDYPLIEQKEENKNLVSIYLNNPLIVEDFIHSFNSFLNVEKKLSISTMGEIDIIDDKTHYSMIEIFVEKYKNLFNFSNKIKIFKEIGNKFYHFEKDKDDKNKLLFRFFHEEYFKKNILAFVFSESFDFNKLKYNLISLIPIENKELLDSFKLKKKFSYTKNVINEMKTIKKNLMKNITKEKKIIIQKHELKSLLFCGITSEKLEKYFDYSNIDNFDYLCCHFNNTKLKIPSLNFTNVKSAENMFSSCEAIIEQTHFNMPILENSNSMFSFCKSIKKLTFENLNNLNDSSSMFYCSSLEEIEFDLKNCSIATYMFYSCLFLKQVIFTNIKKLINANSMFSCAGTKNENKNELKIYNFNRENIINDSWLFYETNIKEENKNLIYIE